MYVITADQIGSRRGPDLVPSALRALAAVRPAAGSAGSTGSAGSGFERTAGDELQGVLTDPEDVVAMVTALLRTGRFRVGVGVGAVQLPVPASPREGRGPAFVAAREAVQAAERSGPVAVRYAASGRTDQVAGPRHAQLAEHALVLMARVLAGRSPEGWAVCDLLVAGGSQRDAAQALGISPSAVSQRLRRAGWTEQQRAQDLAAHHLREAARAAPCRSEPDDTTGT